MKFCTLKSYHIQLEPVRQVLLFDWFITDHLVSGESTLHQVTGYKFTGYTFFSSIENFSAYCPVLGGSILLPPRHPSIFARGWLVANNYGKKNLSRLEPLVRNFNKTKNKMGTEIRNNLIQQLSCLSTDELQTLFILHNNNNNNNNISFITK